MRLGRGDSLLKVKKNTKAHDTKEILANKLPIVKKIAIARPLFFTGCVKTMIFIFTNNIISGEFEDFHEFDNKDSFIEAKQLGEIANHVENEEIEYIEYLENKNKIMYPALWVQFKN